MDLSLDFKTVVLQRLRPKQDSKSSVFVIEIMRNNPMISDLVFKGDVSEIQAIMKKSQNLAVQRFDQALFDASETYTISYENA
jgi:twitching motility protein PilU